MITTIHPIMGMIHSSCHQPLRLVSCKRRAPTASDGRSVANATMPLSTSLMAPVTAPNKNKNRKNHQYSGLLALPLKSAYFEKHTWIDCVNVMMSPCCVKYYMVCCLDYFLRLPFPGHPDEPQQTRAEEPEGGGVATFNSIYICSSISRQRLCDISFLDIM